MANIKGRALVIALYLECRSEAKKRDDGTFYLTDVVENVFGSRFRQPIYNFDYLTHEISIGLKDLGVIYHESYSGRFKVLEHGLWEFECMEPGAIFFNA